ncbi:MAG: phosphoenolpyruvate--protein phosphotransferase [Deltaproteobacteria bacterium HGW-Deltaproteobacteria-17]|nr:MAG: phosphoenolpyruvate--protein phosphotransferase [Deltaproteobacteria bacterium HGW-Deltaproteobacteria-17]
MSIRNVYLFGQGVVPGIVIGRAHLIQGANQYAWTQRHIPPEECSIEIDRLRQAVETSWQQLEDIKEQLAGDSKDPGHILEAHQMMLRDQDLQSSFEKIIVSERINAEWAVLRTLGAWEERFLRIENEYIRERFSDLRFVCTRLLRTLSGQSANEVIAPPPDAVIIATELSPADTILLGRNAVAGLITVRGGKTSHTVIIAKAFEIPTVVGVARAFEHVGEGDLVVLNGHKGEIIVNPDAKLVSVYRAQSHRMIAKDQALLEKCHLPGETADGTQVRVLANLDFADEIVKAKGHGAEGIGLYRTEFLFMVHEKDIADEQVHFQDVKELLERWPGGGPVTLRTFDLGGDKFPLTSQLAREANPALGQRSLRLALAHPHIFKAQLRGFLRAYALFPHIDLRIMFPLVASVREFQTAREILCECYRELSIEGHEIPDTFKIGAMLELPAALMIADMLSRECQFFSIGSNDLIQYALAVDRGNEKVAHMYRGLHPGILRMIHHAIRAADDAGVDISLCGDLATEPIPALIMLGLGLRSFSMPPVFIPYAKDFLRTVRLAEIEELTTHALTLPCADDIEAFMRASLGNRLQDTFWSEISEK